MVLHSLAPFLLDMVDDRDMNVADIEVALRDDWQRQRTVEAWLAGELPFEAMLDMASDYGVDGFEYEDAIAHNVDALIAQNCPIDDAERVMDGLWLPNTI
jgi:hypothetical protein